MANTVLFVDDEPHVTDALKRALRKESYRILTSNSPSEALKILEKTSVEVVVSDEQMPGMTGSEFLSRVRRRHPSTIRIMLTGHASLSAAIRAINEGNIYRFLTKPCSDEELATTIRQAMRQHELLKESRRLLATVRRQGLLLHTLEREYPGITRVERTSSGEILLEDSEGDLNDLIEQMKTEIERCESMHPARP